MALFLTSLAFDGLAEWLNRHGADGAVALVDNASRELEDREVMVGGAEAALAAQGVELQRVDVLKDRAVLERCRAIVMTGGDPFRLLADLRASGADRTLADAHARGIPVAGQSAGAIVSGPRLEPIRITSPFTAPGDLDLAGLALTDSVIFPHQDRPGRAALHREAALRYAGALPLTALWDDEVLQSEDHSSWCIVRGGQRTRIARADDAEGVAEVFHHAARTAWSPFLGEGPFAQVHPDTAGWAKRITRAGHRFLITEDDCGIIGFVWYHQAAGSGTKTPVGEVDTLYTHPRAWGAGVGRRLLERATWNLLCEGFREAILWTEARNERALAMYRTAGWKPDGALDARTYLGVPIRNLRHRLDLTRHAGGT